jgi:hypothetical protein
VTASTVYADPQQTPTTETLATIVDEAHREHLAVMLRPILDEQSLEDAQGDWRGTIQPSDRGRWFATYSALLVQYAEMADAHQVEYFDVGTELNSLQRETEHWHEVISSMRSVYSGRITYSVNFDFRGVGFADTLDFIGLDAYFPLHAPEVATVDEMQQAWAEWTPALRGLAATTGRPVVLTELGARSTPGAHIKPLVWYTQAPPDPEEQARYYQASCNALFPVVTGFYWWMVTFDSPYPNAIQDTSYDPLGKPAEQEIRNCFVSHAAGANPLRAH